MGTVLPRCAFSHDVLVLPSVCASCTTEPFCSGAAAVIIPAVFRKIVFSSFLPILFFPILFLLAFWGRLLAPLSAETNEATGGAARRRPTSRERPQDSHDLRQRERLAEVYAMSAKSG